MPRIDCRYMDGSLSIDSLKDRVEIVWWGETGRRIVVFSLAHDEIRRRGQSGSHYLAEEKLALSEQMMGHWQKKSEIMKDYLEAVIEHIAPMIKLYEPNLPEHPVIQDIRDYLQA